eukprot:scaffold100364_cov15-Tisochrysis_lutea.AAC.1
MPELSWPMGSERFRARVSTLEDVYGRGWEECVSPSCTVLIGTSSIAAPFCHCNCNCHTNTSGTKLLNAP